MDLWVLFGLLVIQMGIGLLVSRGIQSKEDYFLAGRNNGLAIITFSVFATWFGSEACMTSSGIFYNDGMAGGRADPFGYALGLILFGLVIAPRIWKDNVTTLGDVFYKRYGKQVEIMTAVLLALTSILWAGVQVRAFGQVLVAHTSINLDVAIIIATFVAVFYTSLGGLKADNYTDLVQAGVIIIGLVYMLFTVLGEFSDFNLIWQSIPSKRLTFISSQDSFLVQLDGWVVPILGSLVAQELISRASASRAGAIAKQSSIYAGILYLVIGMIPAFLGLLGPMLIPNLVQDNGEQFLILVAQKYLPHLLYVFFSCALISVILSTVDSCLLAVGALFSQNVAPYALPKLSKKYELGLSRVGVVVTGILAAMIGMSSENMYEMVMLASAFGTSGILVVTIFALYTNIGNAISASLAIISGTVSYALFEFMFEISAPYLTSLLISLVFYIAPLIVAYIRSGSLVTARRAVQKD